MFASQAAFMVISLMLFPMLLWHLGPGPPLYSSVLIFLPLLMLVGVFPSRALVQAITSYSQGGMIWSLSIIANMNHEAIDKSSILFFQVDCLYVFHLPHQPPHSFLLPPTLLPAPQGDLFFFKSPTGALYVIYIKDTTEISQGTTSILLPCFCRHSSHSPSLPGGFLLPFVTIIPLEKIFIALPPGRV